MYSKGLLSEFLLGSIVYAPFAMSTTLSLLSVTHQTAVDLVRSPKNVHAAEKSKRKNVSAKRMGPTPYTRLAVIVARRLLPVTSKNVSRLSHRVRICTFAVEKIAIWVVLIRIVI